MNLSLTNRVAVVCGSTQGIGRACAIELATNGATVILMARNEAGLEKVLHELPTPAGQKHSTVQVDFASWQAVRDAAAKLLSTHPQVHILINNSGGPPAGPVFEARPDDFLPAITQHILCSQVLAQTFASGMRDASFGRIINIISTSVITPIKGLGISNTIRGAMGNWGRTLAAELAPFGITVNNVLPGYTRTARLESLIKGRASRAGSQPEEIEQGMISTVPARRFGTPEEIAAVVAFLCSPAAGYVNGVNLPVDGGRLASQ
ncbi:MAG TPA: SDR family oxidoreductase [Phycisphaerales bacterium]|nr:SDR family oxidoreductase [Phycisphaerales bacterium]